MPNVTPCALQRAYAHIRTSGKKSTIQQRVDALTNIIEDHTISTRTAAEQANEQFGVSLTNNNITSHRMNNCRSCSDLLALEGDPTNPVMRTGGSTASKGGRKNHPNAGQEPTYTQSKVRARLDHNEDGTVTLKDVPLSQPLQMDDDLSPLLNHMGLNPDRFEVLKNTFSMWMQSASDGDGNRDVTYMYSAKFRRTGQVDPEMTNKDQIKAWRTVLLKTPKVTKPKYKPTQGTVGTYALWPSDLQLGKTRTAEAVQNFKNGMEDGYEQCQRLIDSGEPIEGLHIGWGGDETEGVANNYANQAHTVELNLAEQLELDYDLRVWAIKRAFDLGLPLSGSSVVSNHGEWSRNGSKDVETTKSDNASTYVARQVKKLFDELEPHTGNHVDWTIPGAHGAHPGIVLNLSGEKVYSSHGHIEKGRGGSTELKTKNAIEKQLLGDIGADRRLIDIRLFVMAHYHHHYTIEDRNRIIMGLPALEALRSSEYMFQNFGVFSNPGLVGMVVGKFDHRPYRHLNVFGTDIPQVAALRDGHIAVA